MLIINEQRRFKVGKEHKVEVVNFDDIEVLVVDNFYENPELVRELALMIPATKHTNRGAYPAAMINITYDLRSLVEPYKHYIQTYFPNHLSDEYIEMCMSQATFMINVMSSDGNEYAPPHIDNPSGDNFASGIYLNKDDECSGGTAFFKNDQYLGYVKMKFNRMILYFQNVQHTARMEMNSFVGGNYRISQQFFI